MCYVKIIVVPSINYISHCHPYYYSNTKKKTVIIIIIIIIIVYGLSACVYLVFNLLYMPVSCMCHHHI